MATENLEQGCGFRWGKHFGLDGTEHVHACEWHTEKEHMCSCGYMSVVTVVNQLNGAYHRDEIIRRIALAYGKAHPSTFHILEWRINKATLLHINAVLRAHHALDLSKLIEVDEDDFNEVSLIQLFGIPIRLHKSDEILLVMVV